MEFFLLLEILYFSMHVVTQECRSCDLLSRGDDLNSQGYEDQMHHLHFNKQDYVMFHKDYDWAHYNLCMAWCKPLPTRYRLHTVCRLQLMASPGVEDFLFLKLLGKQGHCGYNRIFIYYFVRL